MTADAVQERAEVFAVSPVGPYTSLTLIAPGVAAGFRPGRFVSVATGGPDSALVLRRPYPIAAATPSGRYAGTISLVVAGDDAGSRWLAARSPGDTLDVVGALGTPFPLPSQPVTALLAGAGHRAAPLQPLAQELLAGGSRVEVLLGAPDAARLHGELAFKRAAGRVTVVTDDGSAGTRGRVSEVLPAFAEQAAAEVLYAAGPRGLLAAVGSLAASTGLAAHVAFEEAMACGIGTCGSCVVPVRGSDGRTRTVRCCVEGPVLGAAGVRWDLLAS